MQLTAKHKVATPADWKQGGDVIITGAVSDEEAKTLFPGLQDPQALSADDGPAEVALLSPSRGKGFKCDPALAPPLRMPHSVGVSSNSPPTCRTRCALWP